MWPHRGLAGGHTVTVQRIEFLGIHQVLSHELPLLQETISLPALKDLSQSTVRNRKGRKQQRESRRALPPPPPKEKLNKGKKEGKKMGKWLNTAAWGPS